jgi:hypothetical protein
MEIAAFAFEQRVAIPSDAQLVPACISSSSINTITAAAAAHAASKVYANTCVQFMQHSHD